MKVDVEAKVVVGVEDERIAVKFLQELVNTCKLGELKHINVWISVAKN